jgi:hypothetical protein
MVTVARERTTIRRARPTAVYKVPPASKAVK